MIRLNNGIETFFILGFLLFSLQSFAIVPPVCSDLEAEACRPGNLNDGTGTTLLDTPEQYQRLPQLFSKATPATKNEIQRILNLPENAKYRSEAIYSTNLDSDPSCSKTNEENRAACNGKIATIITDYIVTKDSDVDYEKKYRFPDFFGFINDDINKSLTRFFDERVAEDPENLRLEKQIEEKTFPKVKALIVKLISKQPMDTKAKDAILKKINAIKFDGTYCDEDSGGLSVNLLNNAYYKYEDNSFKFCRGLFSRSSSDFSMAWTIAHELSHSIDPCRVATGISGDGFQYKASASQSELDAQYPIANVTACLRQSDSAAIKVGPETPSMYDGMAKLTESATSTPLSEYDKRKNEMKVPFCQGDQATESVPDWIGSEILAEYIEESYPGLNTVQWQNGVTNAMRAFCKPSTTTLAKGKSGADMMKKINEFNEHADRRTRMNKILLVQPTLRKKMGCPPQLTGTVYCSVTKVGPSSATTGTIENNSSSTKSDQ